MLDAVVPTGVFRRVPSMPFRVGIPSYGSDVLLVGVPYRIGDMLVGIFVMGTMVLLDVRIVDEPRMRRIVIYGIGKLSVDFLQVAVSIIV